MFSLLPFSLYVKNQRVEKLRKIPYVTARRRTLTKFWGKLVLLYFLLQRTIKYCLSRGRISYAKVGVLFHLILITKAGWKCRYQMCVNKRGSWNFGIRDNSSPSWKRTVPFLSSSYPSYYAYCKRILRKNYLHCYKLQLSLRLFIPENNIN